MEEDPYNDIDEALVPFHEHIDGMLEIEGEVYDKKEEIRMRIYEVGIESPVQLDLIVDENGKVTIGSSPPLYYVETGVMPVFHSIKLRAVAEEQTEINEQAYES